MKIRLIGSVLVALFTVAIAAGTTPGVAQGTTVGGIISSSTTWTAAGSPYVLASAVQIDHGATLTVEPGVTVQKGTGTEIQVWGTLRAVGTTLSPVRFDWVAIRAITPNPNPPASLIFDHSVLRGVALAPCSSDGGDYGSQIRMTDSRWLYPPSGYYCLLWYPLRECKFERNVFRDVNFSTGCSACDIVFKNNVFAGRSSIWNWAAYGVKPKVNLNSFYDVQLGHRGDYDILGALWLEPSYTSASLDATSNFWDGAAPSSLIYDRSDDLRCASVIPYLPVLDAPDPRTPAFDLVAPVIEILGVSSGGVYEDTATPVVSCGAADLDSLDCEMDGLPWSSGTSVGPGAHWLTATAYDTCGNRTIQRVEFTVETPQLSKRAASIYLKGKITLRVLGGSGPITWRSSNNAVATVSSVGVVTGVKAGTAYISATRNGNTSTCKVTVKNPVLSKSTVSIRIGSGTTLKVTGGSGTITWTSSKRSVATVNSSGLVKGVTGGTAYVSARRNGIKRTCKVTVTKNSYRLSLSRSVTSGKGYINVTAKTYSGSVLKDRKVKFYRSGSYIGAVKTNSHGKARLRVAKNRTDKAYKAVLAGDSKHKTTALTKNLCFAYAVYGHSGYDQWTDVVHLGRGDYRMYVFGDGYLSGWVESAHAAGSSGSSVKFTVTVAGDFNTTGTSYDDGGHILMRILRYM